MFSPANQAHFFLEIDGAEHDFKVLEFTAREALNQPYEVLLTLVSERPDVDLQSLLHLPAWLDTGAGSGFLASAASSGAISLRRSLGSFCTTAASLLAPSKTAKVTVSW